MYLWSFIWAYLAVSSYFLYRRHGVKSESWRRMSDVLIGFAIGTVFLSASIGIGEFKDAQLKAKAEYAELKAEVEKYRATDPARSGQ